MFQFDMVCKAWTDDAGRLMFEGVASSNSLDLQMERMDDTALVGMKDGILGIDLYPSHQPKIGEELGQILDSELKSDGDMMSLIVRGAWYDDNPDALRAYKRLAAGKRWGLSVGGAVTGWHWGNDPSSGSRIRYIDSVSLDHVAVTRTPANTDTMLVAIAKSMDDEDPVPMEKGSVPGRRDLPLAPEATSWAAGPALQRVKEWASDGEGNIDFGKYSDAFMWVDSEKQDLQGSYKFQFADIIDGRLMAVWHAIVACNGRLNQAEIPAADVDKVANMISHYYNRFGHDLPSDTNAGKSVDGEPLRLDEDAPKIPLDETTDTVEELADVVEDVLGGDSDEIEIVPEDNSSADELNLSVDDVTDDDGEGGIVDAEGQEAVDIVEDEVIVATTLAADNLIEQETTDMSTDTAATEQSEVNVTEQEVVEVKPDEQQVQEVVATVPVAQSDTPANAEVEALKAQIAELKQAKLSNEVSELKQQVEKLSAQPQKGQYIDTAAQAAKPGLTSDNDPLGEVIEEARENVGTKKGQQAATRGHSMIVDGVGRVFLGRFAGK